MVCYSKRKLLDETLYPFPKIHLEALGIYFKKFLLTSRPNRYCPLTTPLYPSIVRFDFQQDPPATHTTTLKPILKNPRKQKRTKKTSTKKIQEQKIEKKKRHPPNKGKQPNYTSSFFPPLLQHQVSHTSVVTLRGRRFCISQKTARPRLTSCFMRRMRQSRGQHILGGEGLFF